MRTADTVRTCIGCRKRDSSANLLRTVVSAGDAGQPGVVPDPGRLAPGRGAHLHPTTECLDLAERRKAFPRALRAPGPLELTLVREYVEQHRTKDATVSPRKGART
ncbi:MAG TPA: YlxR family protein [Kribbellaceae bacterium]|nr:YlxR family protein [Kribbellaceae bacterium]